MRQITITCNGNNAVADSYNAGYQGEHNATAIAYSLPDELINQDYTYTVDIELPDGTAISTVINNYRLPLTATLTALSGTIKLQLSITNGGKLIQKSSVVQLSIHPSLISNSTITGGDSTSIQSAEVNADGYLILTLTDDTTIDCGYVVGPQGPQGDKGADGKDGIDYTLTEQDKSDIAQLAAAKIKHIVKTTLDNLLTVNTEYYLGEQTEVNLVYPQTANLGDYICINFISGETAATVISQNCIGLDSFVPNANSICEIHAQYNGQWVCLTSQTEVNV